MFDRSNSSQVGLTELLAEAKNQIEAECFDACDRAQVDEIALIIAEVYRLPPKINISIAGDKLPAEMVKEIYSRLEHEHVQAVISNYRQAKYEIKHVKTYLRTALYNIAFELAGRTDNEFLANS